MTSGSSMEGMNKLLDALKRLLTGKRNPPEDPYAYVTAPKKPRPPYRSAAAVAEPPER